MGLALAYIAYREIRMTDFLEEVDEIMTAQKTGRPLPVDRFPDRVATAVKELRSSAGGVKSWRIEQAGIDLSCEVLHVEMTVVRARGTFREQIIGMPNAISYVQYPAALRNAGAIPTG
jgi:hypothetical protein